MYLERKDIKKAFHLEYGGGGKGENFMDDSRENLF